MEKQIIKDIIEESKEQLKRLERHPLLGLSFGEASSKGGQKAVCYQEFLAMRIRQKRDLIKYYEQIEYLFTDEEE